MEIPKDTNHRTFVFGDFDKDGTANIDDSHPCDPSRKEMVQEVALSDELRQIREHNLKFLRFLKNVKNRYGSNHKIKYRIKGTHSTIGKLRRKCIDNIKDILGVTILCKNKEEIDHIAYNIKQNYSVESDKDYYGNSKSGNAYYKARHIIVRINGNPVEIQLKTKPHYALHLKTHPIYKKYGKIPPHKYRELIRKSREIERREQNG